MDKQEMSVIRELVETESGEYVKAVVAEKPGWLLFKTNERMKTIGCLRLNKNSFATLYIDTKEDILLEDTMKDIKGFNNIEIKSRPTGNFVQNKFKLYNEDQANLIVEAINYVFEEDIVKTGKRVRGQVNAKSIA